MKRYTIVLTEAQARCLYRYACMRVAIYTARNEQHRIWRSIKAICERADAPYEKGERR